MGETAQKLNNYQSMLPVDDEDLRTRLWTIGDELKAKYQRDLDITCTSLAFVDSEPAVLVYISPVETASITLPFSIDGVKVYYRYGVDEEWLMFHA
jgi:hypothetical protein